ncbi:hypothetical protein H2248_011221 [Termitomyces sp. 'cryptogamus']|nr:hypothetical protein H2248_011221 [Termitomyces sp. 'cryptogamus']
MPPLTLSLSVGASLYAVSAVAITFRTTGVRFFHPSFIFVPLATKRSATLIESVAMNGNNGDVRVQ